MILISHRGNINGKIPDAENNPQYIENTLIHGYEVEIDVWLIKGTLWLGHDEPQYEVSRDWLEQRAHKLWIHCKNIKAMEFFSSKDSFNYFWHETDTVTLTSKGFMWAYPGKQPIIKSIAVMPELNGDDFSKCVGICSDHIEKYKA